MLHANSQSLPVGANGDTAASAALGVDGLATVAGFHTGTETEFTGTLNMAAALLVMSRHGLNLRRLAYPKPSLHVYGHCLVGSIVSVIKHAQRDHVPTCRKTGYHKR